MIVVDANIVVYAVVRTAETALAEGVARRDPQWLVPPLWRYEVSNALVTLARAGRLRPDLAEQALGAAEQLVGGGEAGVDSASALREAMRLGITAYDAQYVALARVHGIRCVTADAQLVRRAGGIAVGPADFIAGR